MSKSGNLLSRLWRCSLKGSPMAHILFRRRRIPQWPDHAKGLQWASHATASRYSAVAKWLAKNVTFVIHISNVSLPAAAAAAFLGCHSPGCYFSDYNRACNIVRVSIEWTFHSVVRLFPFIDTARQNRILLSPLKKRYFFAAAAHNWHVSCYGSQTSNYFGLNPPGLAEYFRIGRNLRQ